MRTGRDGRPTGNSLIQAHRSEEHTLNSSHSQISYAVFCLKKKKKNYHKSEPILYYWHQSAPVKPLHFSSLLDNTFINNTKLVKQQYTSCFDLFSKLDNLE